MFFLYAISGRTQDSEVNSNKHYIYFNPGALINVPSGFQVGYDRNVFKNTNWDIQGGPLLYSKEATINDFNATNKSGLRFQTSLKNYLSSRFYVGPTVLYKWVTMNEKIWLDRFDGAYQQRMEISRIRRTVALGFDLGWEYQFTDSPFLLEIGYSIGVQNFKVHYDGQPSDVTFVNLRGIGVAPGTSIFPFFNFNIKIKRALGFKK